MKRSIAFLQLIGFFMISILGTLLHFLYDLTGCKLVALFSAVNESTWEHMKILFFSMLFFAITEFFNVKDKYGNFWRTKLKGIIVGLVLIPTIFYTLIGIFGTTPDFINIMIFFIVVLISMTYETKHFDKSVIYKFENVSFITICIIAVLFIVFTFYPPIIPLFKDPTNQNIGL